MVFVKLRCPRWSSFGSSYNVGCSFRLKSDSQFLFPFAVSAVVSGPVRSSNFDPARHFNHSCNPQAAVGALGSSYVYGSCSAVAALKAECCSPDTAHRDVQHAILGSVRVVAVNSNTHVQLLSRKSFQSRDSSSSSSNRTHAQFRIRFQPTTSCSFGSR